MNYAIRENKIFNYPVREFIRFKVAKKERHFLTEDEVVQLIHHAGDSLIGCVISTLYYTGIRINELCNLELRDIDFNKNSISIRQGKGNKDRIIPMNSKVKETLQTYVESMRPSVRSAYFFATKKSGKVSQGYIRKVIDELVKELSWSKKVTCHTLRHALLQVY